MSYSGDEEPKPDEINEEEDLDLDSTLDDPLLEDELLGGIDDEEDEDLDGFAGLDGSEY